MASLNGFIKLHRKMLDWGWYSDPATKDVFLHLLLTANFRPNTYMGYELLPGQTIIGRKKLATELGLSEKQVRTALDKLEKTGEISRRRTNKFTLVTVENWTIYQGDEDCDGQQTASEGPTNGQQTASEGPHLKNDKNAKNANKEKKDIYIGVPEELREAVMEFAHMRKKKKAPISSERTVTRLLNRLDELATTTEEKIAILNQSTDRCWTDVYPLKGDKENGINGKAAGDNEPSPWGELPGVIRC